MKYNFQNGIIIGITITFFCVLIFTMLHKYSKKNKNNITNLFDINHIQDLIPPIKLDSKNTIHSKQIHFVKENNGKTKWEVTEENNGKKNTITGEGMPPSEVMSKIKPEVNIITQIMGGNLMPASKPKFEEIKSKEEYDSEVVSLNI